MLDQRQSTRRRTLLGGRIEVEKLNGWTVDCTVRNLSTAGARVALPERTVIPDTFALGISGAAPVAARLIWYRNGEAGLTIEAPAA